MKPAANAAGYFSIPISDQNPLHVGFPYWISGSPAPPVQQLNGITALIRIIYQIMVQIQNLYLDYVMLRLRNRLFFLVYQSCVFISARNLTKIIQL